MAATQQRAGEKRRRLRRWLLPLGILLIGIAFALPPLVNINRFHRRITDSISEGIGRPVRISSVKMHLLPRPGFEIENLVVEDDPAFGAEPILRCAGVTAYVRLLSLWRGRIEIARIAFDEPSLNLVRNSAGRWNFDSLLSQAARVPNAPTGQRLAGSLPRFPYIDAGSARINFKIGDEKMPFSFFNADLAVWLANPDEWRVQFEAQPVRTDLTLDLANTGLVRVRGSLRRAPVMSQMPVDLHAEWANAPLGQLSRILTGSDADWRGELDATADITGTAEHARLKVVAQGRGIHRVEFEPGEPLNVDVACEGQFARARRSLDAVTCLAPTGEGHLLLTGAVLGISRNPDPELSLEINHTPVASAFDAVRLMRSGFAPAVRATGTIDGNFTYGRTGQAGPPVLHGQAIVNGLTIAAPALETPLAFPGLHFTMNGPTGGPQPRQLGRSPQHRSRAASKTLPDPAADGPTLLLEPFILSRTTGLPSPLSVSGAFNRSGFSLRAGGQTRLGEFVALGREFGLLRNRSVSFGPQGAADLDLTVHGPWLMPVADPDLAAPPAAVDGSLRLRGAQITGDFLAQPLQIVAAQAIFSGNRVDWTAPSLVYGPIHADGSLSYPVFCQSPPQCLRHFTLHLASLDAATAQTALLGATRHGEIVRQLIARIGQNGGPWPAMTGTVAVGSLTVEALVIRDLNANLALEDRAVQVGSLTGRALDGALNLTGKIELSSGTPHYTIAAKLDHASLPFAAALFQEKWGPGSVNAATTLDLSGFDRKQLLSSASGGFHWEWSRGGLAAEAPEKPVAETLGIARPENSAPAKSPLLRFDNWVADGTIAGSQLLIQRSEVVSGKNTAPVTGTISFDRELNLAVPCENGVLNIGGTLEQPRTSATPNTASGRPRQP